MELLSRFLFFLAIGVGAYFTATGCLSCVAMQKPRAKYRYTGGHSGSSPYCPRAPSTFLSGLLLRLE